MDEKIKFHLEDYVNHKKHVLDSCYKLAIYFAENNELETAIKLMKRASIHDISKMNNGEFNNLLKVNASKDTFTNPNATLNDFSKKCIEEHYKNNTHHPEHWENYNDMDELSIMEMCCDWHARSTQYKTNFLEFVKTRQENRFKFDEDFFQKVWKYCLILNK